MRRILVAFGVACLVCIPCSAAKLMMFSSFDRYIARADGIWVIEVVKQVGKQPWIGRTYEAKVLQVLKGDPTKGTLTICALSRALVAGDRYLVFGFSQVTSGAWIDNGNVSPVPVPSSFSLTQLKGKSVKQQVVAIMTARRQALSGVVQQAREEMALLDRTLSSEKRSKAPGRSEKEDAQDIQFKSLEAP